MKFNYSKIIAISLTVMIIAMIFAQASLDQNRATKLKYSEFTQAVREDRVQSVESKGSRITGEFKPSEAPAGK